MAGEAYSAEGVAETDVRAAIVGDALFHDLLGRSAVFRRFVFAACGRRLADLLCRLQEVAFERIDRRLAQILLAMPARQGAIAATHQTLATELGTAREVVSRQLKDFERRGWLRLGRGSIVLLRPEAIAKVGDPSRTL
jgi:CRP/FNR family transcriptional regulator